MRRITKKQAVEISDKIAQLIGHFGNMDGTGVDFYALTIAFGSRAQIVKSDKY